MKKTNGLRRVIGLLAVLTGCAGSLSGGYYVSPEPDQYLFGGVYYNNRDAYRYSHRGYESRGRAHSGARQDREHSKESHGGKR
jgi:hypothetical protein